MRVLGVIPVRMEAVRFPGKPLALLAGKPLVQWVWEAASRASDVLDELVVATDSDEIAAVVEGFGGRVSRTRADHATGSDRVAEVAAHHPGADVVVNVQGDQPFVKPEMLSALVAAFDDDSVRMATVGCPLDTAAADDPNTVKVITNVYGDALYFSRAPIPHRRDTDVRVPVLHHLGLYAFRQAFLAQYATLEPTPLERAEGLEQLRAVEHGIAIRVQEVAHGIDEVNTPEDLRRAEARVGAA